MTNTYQPLPEDKRQRIADLAAAKGANRAADLLDISKQTLDRVLGGLALHPWTVQKLTVAIEKRNQEGKQP